MNEFENLNAKLQIEESYISGEWFEIWRTRFNVYFKAIAGEEKTVAPESTSLWWETHLATILQFCHNFTSKKFMMLNRSNF